MAVFRYRTIEDMPPPWTDPNDPANLRHVARMLAFYARLTSASQRVPGVRRFRSLDDANAARGDPYRRSI